MNFNELFQKMRELDTPVDETTSSGAVASVAMPIGEKEIDECGGDMMPMSAPRQSDSVTMNLSMNGSGAGGIRDLMDILRSLDGEEGGEEGDLGAIIDKMDGDDEHKDVIIGGEVDEFANSPATTNNPNPQVAPMSRMTATGDDMHSKGAESPKVNGGGNPMSMHEELVQRLSSHYESIKEAKKESEPEGTYSKKRFETDGQRVARLAKEKRQAEKKKEAEVKEDTAPQGTESASLNESNDIIKLTKMITG